MTTDSQEAKRAYLFTRRLLRIARKSGETLIDAKVKLRDDRIRILDTFEELRHVMKNNLDRGYYCVVPGHIIHDMTKEDLYDVFCCPNYPEDDPFDPYPEPLEVPASNKTVVELCNVKRAANYVFYNGKVILTCKYDHPIGPIGPYKIKSVTNGRLFKVSPYVPDSRPLPILPPSMPCYISFRFYQDDEHPIREAFIHLLEHCKKHNRLPSNTLKGAYGSKYALFIGKVESRKYKGESVMPETSTPNVVEDVRPIYPVLVSTCATTPKRGCDTWGYHGWETRHKTKLKYHEVSNPDIIPDFDLRRFLHTNFPNKMQKTVEEDAPSTQFEHA